MDIFSFHYIRQPILPKPTPLYPYMNGISTSFDIVNVIRNHP